MRLCELFGVGLGSALLASRSPYSDPIGRRTAGDMVQVLSLRVPLLTFMIQFLWFPCGIVRGALAALGINATVQAESSELPGAVFQIKTIPVKS